MMVIMLVAMSNASVLAANISTYENTPTLQEMKKYLLSIGTEQEFLNKINDSRIEGLYQACVGKEVSFAGYKTEIVEIQDSDPILRLTDAHTFTFDGTKFRIGGIYAESGYQVNDQWILADSVDAPATAEDGGLGWYLSIDSKYVSSFYTNSGGADIYLIPRNANATYSQLSSSMYYTYAHQKTGASISLSPGGAGITISGGSHDYQSSVYYY